jgi:hypothetical protein
VSGLRPALPLVAVALSASLVLGWNLGDRYLWQDEAAAALLAERMLRFGRPLAWDGRNLITMDFFEPARAGPDSLRFRIGEPERAVRYFAEHGDFKADTTWIGQPWAQFVAAGLSLALLGRGTLAARLPFVLAGVLSVVLLVHLARSRLRDGRVAALAAALLLGNVFWLLHARQCRYYALSSLFLLTTFLAYLRWREGRRGGALLLLAFAFAFFHSDYGTFWPTLGVLGADVLLAGRRTLRRALVPAGLLAIAIAPWVWYYELLGRLKSTPYPFARRFFGTLFNLNEYQLPLLLLPLVGWALWRARPRVAGERHVVGLAVAIVLALFAWVPIVTPYPFHRYLVAATPLAALVTAFALVRAADRALAGQPRARSAALVSAALVLGLTPLASHPGLLLVPPRHRPEHASWLRADFPWQRHPWLRSELVWTLAELAGCAPDPNRLVIEYLRPRLREGDEILVNYEDAPFMFYTDARVRGGIPAFRIEDPGAPPPRFAVVRRSVPFTHWDVFKEELRRHRWRRLPVAAPDVPYGNSPDPSHRFFPLPPDYPQISVLERVGDARGRDAEEEGG